MNRYSIRRFNSEIDCNKPFDCGNTDLNNFLTETDKGVPNATQHGEELLATTYIIEDNHSSSIVAYFSLLNDKIERDLSNKQVWNKLSRRIPNAKRRKSYPAVKIGRLAVSKEYKSRGIGSFILDFAEGWFFNRNSTGCRYITVDALGEAMPFYVKNDFKPLQEPENICDNDTTLMYFDLMTLKASAA